MKNKLHNSILICTVLILSFVSCKIENNSKPTERFKKTNKIDEVLIDTITTITSIDKKWNIEMHTVDKSELRLASGERFQNFQNRKFYCLEIKLAKADTLNINIPLYIQTSPSAIEAYLSVFIYDNKKFKYSQVTDGYDYEKKQIQFLFSTDLLRGFNDNVSIAISYYNGQYFSPLSFDPYSNIGSLPLILFENISIDKMTASLILNDLKNKI